MPEKENEKGRLVGEILSSQRQLPDGTYYCKFCSKVYRCQHSCPELTRLLVKVK